MNWEQIKKANSEIEPFIIKQNVKDEYGNWHTKEVSYAQVKERVLAFRKVCPNGRIETQPDYKDNHIVFEAKIYVDDVLIAKAHAGELSNTKFALEKCETSAVGRALGFAGFGIDMAIASAEDMQETEIFDENPLMYKDQLERFKKLSVRQQADILNVMGVKEPEKINANLLKELIDNAK